MNVDKMKAHEIQSAIGEALSPEASEYWCGMDDAGRNDCLIHAQREGFDAAVQLVEDLAKPERTSAPCSLCGRDSGIDAGDAAAWYLCKDCEGTPAATQAGYTHNEDEN